VSDLAPILVAVAVLMVLATPWTEAPPPPPPPPPALEARFSPGGHCSAAIVTELAAARRSVRVLAYSFTSAPIATALIEAKQRGVDVRAVLDESNRTDRRSRAGWLEAAGIPVAYDDREPIMHMKVIVIDGQTVLTGSYNLSVQAERNAEDLVTIRDADLAGRFAAEFARHEGHAAGR
jgi:phosphatidylserine/phosphatidylglycerophosphate/cardiolipin synthase-like enzyme